MSKATPTILVFDSGLGGLTVLREIVKLLPLARYIYAADDAAFPYGRLTPDELSGRVIATMGALIGAYRPDLVVVACNTASTLVLPQLRARFSVPFVGTVPAIKPACAASVSKRVSVLGTEGTVAREYTQTLIRDFGQGCEVTLVGSPRLAVLAETHLNGKPVSDDAIATEIAPGFVQSDGKRTDMVVLACTHYPLLLDRFERLAPWPVTFLDPAPAIARRASDLIGGKIDSRIGGRIGSPPGSMTPAPGCSAAPDSAATGQFVYTSGRPPQPKLVAALEGFGLRLDSGTREACRIDTPAVSA